MDTGTMCMLVVFVAILVLLFVLLAVCVYKKNSWKATNVKRRLDHIRKNQQLAREAAGTNKTTSSSTSRGSWFNFGSPTKLNLKLKLPRFSTISEGRESMYERSKSVCSTIEVDTDGNHQVSTDTDESCSSDCGSDKSYQKQGNRLSTTDDKSTADSENTKVHEHDEKKESDKLDDIRKESESQENQQTVDSEKIEISVQCKESAERESSMYQNVTLSFVQTIFGSNQNTDHQRKDQQQSEDSGSKEHQDRRSGRLGDFMRRFSRNSDARRAECNSDIYHVV